MATVALLDFLLFEKFSKQTTKCGILSLGGWLSYARSAYFVSMELEMYDYDSEFPQRPGVA